MTLAASNKSTSAAPLQTHLIGAPTATLMVSRTEDHPPSNEALIGVGSGFYLKTGFQCESYLYPAEAMLPRTPSESELRAMSGSRKRETVDGRKITVQKPSFLYCPLVVDCEYQTAPHPEQDREFHDYVLEKLRLIRRGSIPLTVQVNAIRPTKPGVRTFLHPVFLKAFPKAEPIITRSTDPISSYLSELIPGSEIIPFENNYDENLVAMRKVRVLRIDLFAHFAVADLYKIWPDGIIRDQLKALSVGEGAKIDQSRRLKFEYEYKRKNGGRGQTRWLRMPALVSLGGIRFALELSVVDTVGMAGQAGRSLAGFSASCGLPLDTKEIYKGHHKAQMLIEMIAACDQKSLEAGAYRDLEAVMSGPLKEALKRRAAYGTGNPFIDYAEGDVGSLYQAISAFDRQFYELYTALGLEDYYKPPKMTIGATVHQLMTAAAFRLFEVDGKKLTSKEQKFVLENGFEPSRARGLAAHATWAAANARVFGGRVLTTAPTLIGKKNASACDMDLSAAYARSMDVQILPIGRPMMTHKFTSRSARNRHETLEVFLKKYRKEFVPGCWQLLISVEDSSGKPIRLPSDQDFLSSWVTPKIFQGAKAEELGEWLDRSDLVKVRSRQITNSTFAQDQLDWLEHCCSRELRNFILKNARVKASLFYPAKERIKNDDPQKLLEEFRKAEVNGRENTCEVKIKKGASKITTEENEFHGWIGITVSDLITGPLSRERDRWKPFTKMYGLLREKSITSESDLHRLNSTQRSEFDYLATDHEGGHPGGAAGLIETSRTASKHPKDELAKSCANTVYGDLVSPYFALSNPCVGNNITSRVRSIIWYFEKACRSFNTITDGGVFDLNEVHSWRLDRGGLNEKNTVFALKKGYKALRNDGIILKPLGHANENPVYSWAWDGDRVILDRQSGRTELDVSAARKIVDGLTLEHCQNMFSHRISVINPKTSPFKFEAKGIVKDVVLHGSANYYFAGGGHDAYREDQPWTIKFRSYRPDSHETILLPFFKQLLNNPEAVDRKLYNQPFTVPGVLMVRRYRDGFDSYYSKSFLEPGDTEFAVKIFREFTPSAFLFESDDQERKFLNFHQRHREIGNGSSAYASARGQSVESFYTNENEILNYRQMMLDTEAAIRDGRTSIHPELEILEHPSRQLALKMKRERLKEMILPEEIYEEEDPFVHDYDISELPDEVWY